MPDNPFSLIVSFIGGGFVVKLIEFWYSERKQKKESKHNAKDVINRNMDPILKSADELVGKIRSLALTDFKEITDRNKITANNIAELMPLLEVVYLVSQFWARVQTVV